MSAERRRSTFREQYTLKLSLLFSCCWPSSSSARGIAPAYMGESVRCVKRVFRFLICVMLLLLHLPTGHLVRGSKPMQDVADSLITSGHSTCVRHRRERGHQRRRREIPRTMRCCLGNSLLFLFWCLGEDVVSCSDSSSFPSTKILF